MKYLGINPIQDDQNLNIDKSYKSLVKESKDLTEWKKKYILP